MNIVDVVIVLLILLCGVVGFKRGVFKQLVSTVGFVLVFILAFYLKNPVAEFLSLNLPFFTVSSMCLKFLKKAPYSLKFVISSIVLGLCASL